VRDAARHSLEDRSHDDGLFLTDIRARASHRSRSVSISCTQEGATVFLGPSEQILEVSQQLLEHLRVAGIEAIATAHWAEAAEDKQAANEGQRERNAGHCRFRANAGEWLGDFSLGFPPCVN